MVFMGCWLIWGAWVQFGQRLLIPGAGAAVVDALLAKGVIWGGPALLLLLREQKPWLIEPRRLFVGPFPWLPLVVLGCMITAFLYTMRLICLPLGVIVFFTPTLVLLSLCAGVYEEVFFRGYLFNRQAADLGLWRAVVFNGVLFALYHFPELLWGQGWAILFSLRGVLLFVMGAVFCLILTKWENLVLPMLLHIFWNVLSFWFGLSG